MLDRRLHQGRARARSVAGVTRDTYYCTDPADAELGSCVPEREFVTDDFPRPASFYCDPAGHATVAAQNVKSATDELAEIALQAKHEAFLLRAKLTERESALRLAMTLLRTCNGHPADLQRQRIAASMQIEKLLAEDAA